MKRVRFVLLVVAGAVLPVALAVAAVLISSGVGASTPVAPLPIEAGREDHGSTPGESPSPDQPTPTVSPTSSESPGATPSVDDNGGRCSEPEHSNDPSCTPGSGGSSGDSGKSGGGDDSGSSGPGGGDD